MRVRVRARQHAAMSLLAGMLAMGGCGTDSQPDTIDFEDGVGSDATSVPSLPGDEGLGGEADDEGVDASEAQPFAALGQEGCVLIRGDGPKGKLRPRVEVVARGLEAPWDIAFLPNGDMLVTERAGRLRLIRSGRVVSKPVLDFSIPKIRVVLGSEGGLLGVLLHPDFASNRLFYLYFTDRNPNGTPVNRLVRYVLSSTGTSATLDRVILDDIPAGGHHQGGRMRIGPDGKLYVGVGAYEPELAQKPGILPGKMLRMNLDGTVPDDNPTPGSLIFASGIRNTQAYDWVDDEHMVLMDHGPSSIELNRPTLRGYDELNVLRGGENMGWPRVWGCRERAGITPPVMAWRKVTPPAGGAVYTGTAIPAWTGSFFFATLGFLPGEGKSLQRIAVNPDNPYVVEEYEVFLQNEYGRLRTVIMGPDGHLYLTTSNCENRGVCPAGRDLILRIVGAN